MLAGLCGVIVQLVVVVGGAGKVGAGMVVVPPLTVHPESVGVAAAVSPASETVTLQSAELKFEPSTRNWPAESARLETELVGDETVTVAPGAAPVPSTRTCPLLTCARETVRADALDGTSTARARTRSIALRGWTSPREGPGMCITSHSTGPVCETLVLGQVERSGASASARSATEVAVRARAGGR